MTNIRCHLLTTRSTLAIILSVIPLVSATAGAFNDHDFSPKARRKVPRDLRTWRLFTDRRWWLFGQARYRFMVVLPISSRVHGISVPLRTLTHLVRPIQPETSPSQAFKFKALTPFTA